MVDSYVMIRVSKELREWIEYEAKRNDRSMSKECRRMILNERRRRERKPQGAASNGATDQDC